MTTRQTVENYFFYLRKSKFSDPKLVHRFQSGFRQDGQIGPIGVTCLKTFDWNMSTMLIIVRCSYPTLIFLPNIYIFCRKYFTQNFIQNIFILGTAFTMTPPCPQGPPPGLTPWSTACPTAAVSSPVLLSLILVCGKSPWRLCKMSGMSAIFGSEFFRKHDVDISRSEPNNIADISEADPAPWLMVVSTPRMPTPSRRSSPRTSWSTIQRAKPPSPSSSTLPGSSTGSTARTASSSSLTPSLLSQMFTSWPPRSWLPGQDTQNHCLRYYKQQTCK